MLPTRTYRTAYSIPQYLRTSTTGEALSLDDMTLLASRATSLGKWCQKVLTRENDKILDLLIGDDNKLPRGVTNDDETVTALVSSAGQVWQGESWVDPDEPVDLRTTMDLSEEDVAYVARAFQEGATEVIFRPSLPLAFIAAAEGGQTGSPEVPEGGVVVAVVDGSDKDAVLELLAVAPGPEVWRRNDGAWHVDNGWLPLLKSISPPSMVKLDESVTASVAQQVDEATSGMPFEELAQDDWDLYKPVAASAYLQELQRESDQQIVSQTIGLLAVAGRELSPKDAKNTERLKRYWTTGPGAAKIRWGTPGSWRRCYRHLVKYVGPKIAPGLCTNLGKRLGGHGVATHVGDRRGRG